MTSLKDEIICLNGDKRSDFWLNISTWRFSSFFSQGFNRPYEVLLRPYEVEFDWDRNNGKVS